MRTLLPTLLSARPPPALLSARLPPASGGALLRMSASASVGSCRESVGAGEGLRTLALADATPADWARVTEVLSPHMRENRMERMREVASKRRGGLHLVLENIADPYNAAAILRSCEALGVQHVHAIESVGEMRVPAEALGMVTPESSRRGRQATGMVSAGSSRWLTISKYRSARECLEVLHEARLTVLASDCPPCEDADETGAAWETQKGRDFDARPLDELMASLRAEGAGPERGVAVVLGNERRGVSRAPRTPNPRQPAAHAAIAHARRATRRRASRARARQLLPADVRLHAELQRLGGRGVVAAGGDRLWRLPSWLHVGGGTRGGARPMDAQGRQGGEAGAAPGGHRIHRLLKFSSSAAARARARGTLQTSDETDAISRRR